MSIQLQIARGPLLSVLAAAAREPVDDCQCLQRPWRAAQRASRGRQAISSCEGRRVGRQGSCRRPPPFKAGVQRGLRPTSPPAAPLAFCRYAVQFMTVVSCTACVYTCYHFLMKK